MKQNNRWNKHRKTASPRFTPWAYPPLHNTSGSGVCPVEAVTGGHPGLWSCMLQLILSCITIYGALCIRMWRNFTIQRHRHTLWLSKFISNTPLRNRGELLVCSWLAAELVPPRLLPSVRRFLPATQLCAVGGGHSSSKLHSSSFVAHTGANALLNYPQCFSPPRGTVQWGRGKTP